MRVSDGILDSDIKGCYDARKSNNLCKNKYETNSTIIENENDTTKSSDPTSDNMIENNDFADFSPILPSNTSNHMISTRKFVSNRISKMNSKHQFHMKKKQKQLRKGIELVDNIIY